MTHLVIAKLAREHGVETFLAGDGGNEFFGSNMRYVTDKSLEVYQALPLSLTNGGLNEKASDDNTAVLGPPVLSRTSRVGRSACHSGDAMARA
jgi:asparagine synthase (glutamine-hydrolysing)